MQTAAQVGLDLLDPAAAARWLAFPPCGVWATDCDLRITLAIGAAFPGAVLEAPAMVGTRLSDMPHATTEMRDAHRVAAVSGVSTRYECAVGERTWEVRVSAVRRADGSVSGTIGTGTDVTRRKELEALLGERARDVASRDAATADAHDTLRDSETRFRSAFDDAPIGMVLVDLSATIIRANDAFAEFLGYQRDELVGLDIQDITHADDDNLTHAALTAMTAGDDRSVFDKRYVRKDGTVVWGHVVATPIGSRNGSVLSLVSHIDDITELRSLQQELAQVDAMYRAALASSPDLILVGSPDGTIWLSSHSIERILGYAPDDLVGSNYTELIHPDDRAAAAKALASLRTGEQSEPMDPIRVRVRHKDGSERVLEGSAAAAGQDGHVPGLIVTNAHDVTTHVRLEEELRQSQKLEALGGLVAGVAHDFNNMLLVIRAWAELLTKHIDPDREDLAAELRAIIAAADRAAALTHQLLAFSHRRAAKREALDLRDVVSGMAALLVRLIGENVTLAVTVPDEPAWIDADRSQVEQVIANLTINGRDAIRTHGTVSIDAQLDRDRGEVRLVVADDGVGMDNSTAARAFEPFFTTKGEHGTGLGLATVRDIVTEIGGEVGVVSAPGSGATFTVRLPLATAPLPDDAVEENGSRRGGGERILLVEDEAIVRDVVARLLRDGGYEVIEAANGDDALAYAATEPDSVDLLLSDIILTSEDGRGVAQKFVTYQPHAVVILMSGYPSSASDPGTFLRKPFGGAELLQAVRAALDAPQAAPTD